MGTRGGLPCGSLAHNPAAPHPVDMKLVFLIISMLHFSPCAAVPTEDLHSRRELLSFSRQFCYVHSNGTLQTGAQWIPDDCTDEPSEAPACTVASTPGPDNLCKLTQSQNGVDRGRWDDYSF